MRWRVSDSTHLCRTCRATPTSETIALRRFITNVLSQPERSCLTMASVSRQTRSLLSDRF